MTIDFYLVVWRMLKETADISTKLARIAIAALILVRVLVDNDTSQSFAEKPLGMFIAIGVALLLIDVRSKDSK